MLYDRPATENAGKNLVRAARAHGLKLRALVRNEEQLEDARDEVCILKASLLLGVPSNLSWERTNRRVRSTTVTLCK
eukprot:CFRG2313T1